MRRLPGGITAAQVDKLCRQVWAELMMSRNGALVASPLPWSLFVVSRCSLLLSRRTVFCHCHVTALPEVQASPMDDIWSSLLWSKGLCYYVIMGVINTGPHSNSGSATAQTVWPWVRSVTQVTLHLWNEGKSLPHWVVVRVKYDG